MSAVDYTYAGKHEWNEFTPFQRLTKQEQHFARLELELDGRGLEYLVDRTQWKLEMVQLEPTIIYSTLQVMTDDPRRRRLPN